MKSNLGTAKQCRALYAGVHKAFKGAADELPKAQTAEKKKNIKRKVKDSIENDLKIFFASLGLQVEIEVDKQGKLTTKEKNFVSSILEQIDKQIDVLIDKLDDDLKIQMDAQHKERLISKSTDMLIHILVASLLIGASTGLLMVAHGSILSIHVSSLVSSIITSMGSLASAFGAVSTKEVVADMHHLVKEAWIKPEVEFEKLQNRISDGLSEYKFQVIDTTKRQEEVEEAPEVAKAQEEAAEVAKPPEGFEELGELSKRLLHAVNFLAAQVGKTSQTLSR